MVQPAFTRKKLLRPPEVLIESICALCGFSVIAGKAESLDRLEADHRVQCRLREGERRKAVARTGERRIAILGEVENSTRHGVDQRKEDRRSVKDRRTHSGNIPLK